jgi:FAD-dependent urate hydroxylase
VLHDIPDAWGSGATTLLGDAAHVFPPSQAQGANQALEDAWLLRRALSEERDAVARLRSYERLRAVRARRVAKMAASESTNRPPGALTRFAVRLIPASMTARAYTSLIRRFSSVLADERIG